MVSSFRGFFGPPAAFNRSRLRIVLPGCAHAPKEHRRNWTPLYLHMRHNLLWVGIIIIITKSPWNFNHSLLYLIRLHLLARPESSLFYAPNIESFIYTLNFILSSFTSFVSKIEIQPKVPFRLNLRRRKNCKSWGPHRNRIWDCPFHKSTIYLINFRLPCDLSLSYNLNDWNFICNPKPCNRKKNF